MLMQMVYGPVAAVTLCSRAPAAEIPACTHIPPWSLLSWALSPMLNINNPCFSGAASLPHRAHTVHVLQFQSLSSITNIQWAFQAVIRSA